MPRIPSAIVESVIFLYRSVSEAADGKGPGGSGFVVSVPTEGGSSFLYGVTNHHVVTQDCTVVRLSNRHGQTKVVNRSLDDWHEHPAGDDVAITPLGLSGDYPAFSSAVPRSHFITEEDVAREDVGPGTEAFFLGRFLDLEGTQYNEPVARFGNLSLSPPRPVRHEKRDFDQESFLVEARSVSGYSGSPVFLYFEGYSAMYINFSGVRESTTLLLGIDWGHHPVPISQRDEYGAQNAGIIDVVPAWKLAELLDMEEHMKHRNDEERRWIADRAGDGAVEDLPATSEADRFEELTKKLVAVPKKEIGTIGHPQGQGERD